MPRHRRSRAHAQLLLEAGEQYRRLQQDPAEDDVDAGRLIVRLPAQRRPTAPPPVNDDQDGDTT